MLIKDVLIKAERVLHNRAEAEILLKFILKIEREQIFAHPETEMPEDLAALFFAKCASRAKGKPLAYLTHHKEFFGLDFYVDERVLIPRPETEILVEAVAEKLLKMDIASVCDVGTGSGCIAVSLAKIWPDAKITAVDISDAALKVAKKNAKIHGVLDRVEFIRSDLMSAVLDRHFDIIVANLPYISTDEKHLVDKEVLEFEPRRALFAGKKGLELFEKLFKQLALLVTRYSLRYPKWLIVEIGFNQRPAIEKLIKRYFGDVNVEWKKDLAGLDRVFIISF